MIFVYIFLVLLCSFHGAVTKDVEEKAGCGGDLNAEFSACPPLPACQLTCDGQGDDCSPGCMEPGCVCKRGFVYNEKHGKCTRSQECTEGCKGDPNSVFSFCTPRCESTCNNPFDLVCSDDCADPGCMCKSGFFLDEKIGKCVERWECPEIECEDENAEYKRCPTRCEGPTCYSKDINWCYGNPEPCEPPSCRCKHGLVLDESSGKCINPDNCPVTGCDGDLNAEFRWCSPPRDCDRRCNDGGPTEYICLPICTNPRCVCRTGFVLNENGKCVEPWDCPAW